MNTIRRHLGWKLFVSYLAVIVVGVVSLAIAARLHAPTALDRHMAGMPQSMSGMTGMMSDLESQFVRAINESVLVAADAAFLGVSDMLSEASRV